MASAMRRFISSCLADLELMTFQMLASVSAITMSLDGLGLAEPMTGGRPDNAARGEADRGKDGMGAQCCQLTPNPASFGDAMARY